MNRRKLIFAILSACFLLVAFAGLAQEEETITGKVDTILRTDDGQNDSAKFSEYGETPDGISGEIELNYERKEKYFFEFKATEVGENDQKFKLRTGIYGQYKLEFVYDRIPHAFAYDAKTLYSGVGGGTLTIADAIQDNLQNSVDSPDSAARLQGYMNDAFDADLEYTRKTTGLNFDLVAFDPFNFRFEFSSEERDGTKPLGASFGFGNAIEVAEPVDYTTNQYRFIAEYARKAVYLNATLYFSTFENNIDTITFDNPFRALDSTAANAYSQSYGGGASTGLMDLTPDNKYSSFSLSGSFKLPARSYLTLNAAWGKMRQDDELQAYTTNTAISTGAVTADAAYLVPFNAWDRATLPVANADAEVDTTLYNLLLTSSPVDWFHLRAKYRYYKYDNDSEHVQFPGYARYDAVWEPIHVTPHQTSYRTEKGNVDFSFDLPKRSSFSVGYTFEDISRSENREVTDSNEDIFTLTFDTKPVSWFDLRLSYEIADRGGEYDYTAPFEHETVTAQLPWLRRFDEADRDRDRLQVLANFYPVEALTLSLSHISGEDDYEDSYFGLLDNEHKIYTFEIDYSPSAKWNVYGFYNHEDYENSQRARQWSPSTTAGSPDPYYGTTTYDSPSNWETDSKDEIKTYGLGFSIGFIPDKLKLKVCWSHSDSDGRVNLYSPVGDPASDLNAWVPVNFETVDDTKFDTLDARLKYCINKNLSIAFGYMWERFDFDDFNEDGYKNVPTLINGNYNPILSMDTLLKDYDLDIFYMKIAYRF